MVMKMTTYAIVQQKTVSNVVLWDGDPEGWAPPEGCEAIAVSEETGYPAPGDSWDGSRFQPRDVEADSISKPDSDPPTSL